MNLVVHSTDQVSVPSALVPNGKKKKAYLVQMTLQPTTVADDAMSCNETVIISQK